MLPHSLKGKNVPGILCTEVFGKAYCCSYQFLFALYIPVALKKKHQTFARTPNNCTHLKKTTTQQSCHCLHEAHLYSLCDYHTNTLLWQSVKCFHLPLTPIHTKKTPKLGFSTQHSNGNKKCSFADMQPRWLPEFERSAQARLLIVTFTAISLDVR